MTKSAFSPHRIESDQFEVIRDNILVTDMEFKGRQLNSGVILLNDNGTTAGIRPRWARVYAVGPDQTDVRVGDWICVAHGRWTRGLDIEDEHGEKTIRRVDPKDIMMISDGTERPNDNTVSEAIQASNKNKYS
jgi:hypothetical protein